MTTVEYLGSEAENLLGYTAKVSSDLLHLPGSDFIDRTWKNSDRNPQVLRNLASIYNHGRLGGTGYLSILPVDQGIEHSAGASFTPNPAYFDPSNKKVTIKTYSPYLDSYLSDDSNEFTLENCNF